jgi:hypothetical protein
VVWLARCDRCRHGVRDRAGPGRGARRAGEGGHTRGQDLGRHDQVPAVEVAGDDAPAVVRHERRGPRTGGLLSLHGDCGTT